MVKTIDRTESTGWMLTDAIIFCDCSKCGSQRGTYCQTPSGRKAHSTHTERTASYVTLLREQGKM